MAVRVLGNLAGWCKLNYVGSQRQGTLYQWMNNENCPRTPNDVVQRSLMLGWEVALKAYRRMRNPDSLLCLRIWGSLQPEHSILDVLID